MSKLSATGKASPPNELTYQDPSYYGPLFDIEDQHFWFQARNRIIASLVRQIIDGWQPGYCVLEVGCGTGVVWKKLEEVCRPNVVIDMDLFSTPLA